MSVTEGKSPSRLICPEDQKPTDHIDPMMRDLGRDPVGCAGQPQAAGLIYDVSLAEHFSGSRKIPSLHFYFSEVACMPRTTKSSLGLTV
jgi:hypothetical protein